MKMCKPNEKSRDLDCAQIRYSMNKNYLPVDFLIASFLEKSSRIKEGITKTMSPILAALGSPSRTELKAHAIPKIKRKAPRILVVQAGTENFNF
jgi:hypothetical protein